jgi:DNA-binding Xre family transcriptional regulator
MRLSKALKLMRATENIGVREQAKKIGISPASLSRIENGKDCDAPSTVKLIVWLISSDAQQQ